MHRFEPERFYYNSSKITTSMCQFKMAGLKLFYVTSQRRLNYFSNRWGKHYLHEEQVDNRLKGIATI